MHPTRLPPELLERIFQTVVSSSSVPFPNLDFYPNPRPTLFNLCLVSSAFTRPGQKVLWRQVCIKSNSAAQDLAESDEKLDGKLTIREMKSVGNAFGRTLGTGLVKRVLERGKDVKTLVLVGLAETVDHPSEKSMTDTMAENMSELQDLSLYNTSLSTRPLRKLPNDIGPPFKLRSLSLDHSTYPFSQLSTPCESLTALRLEFSSPSDPALQEALLPNFHLISHSLSSLTLSPASQIILKENLEDLPELKQLTFSAMFRPTDVQKLLASLPADEGLPRLEEISLEWNLSFQGLLDDDEGESGRDKIVFSEVLGGRFVVGKKVKIVGFDRTLREWLFEDENFDAAVKAFESRGARILWEE